MREADVQTVHRPACSRRARTAAPPRRAGRAAARSDARRSSASRTRARPTPTARGWPRTSRRARPAARSRCCATDVWVLSLARVRPDMQSRGLGRKLLAARPRRTARAPEGGIIATSQDPRALRAYARLGLDAAPVLRREGRPRDVDAPPGVREGDASDIPFTEAVDRQVRGAAHGPDISVLLDSGQHAARRSDRGYAVVDAERRPAPARRVRRGRGARSPRRRPRPRRRQAGRVNWITGRQQWAIDVCLQARMDLRTDIGALFSAATSARSTRTCRAGRTCDPPDARSRRAGGLRADRRRLRAPVARERRGDAHAGPGDRHDPPSPPRSAPTLAAPGSPSRTGG